MKHHSFERLEVWQKSRFFTKNVYTLTQQFPNEERFGLTQQVRRATLSVTCNLAEGSSRITGKEQARFSEIAFGSLMETLNLLILAEDLGYLSPNTLNQIRPTIDEISNKINALRASQLKRS